jgi:hypothetical protein
MSHTDIRESGTCAALPLRDAWGRPRRSSWWSEPRPEYAAAPRVLVGPGPTRPTRPVVAR